MPEGKRFDSRGKGCAFERQVARALGGWLGVELKRSPLSGGWSAKAAPGDIIPVADPEKFPFVVECKATEDWSVDGYLRADDPRRTPLGRYLEQTLQATADRWASLGVLSAWAGANAPFPLPDPETPANRLQRAFAGFSELSTPEKEETPQAKSRTVRLRWRAPMPLLVAKRNRCAPLAFVPARQLRFRAALRSIRNPQRAVVHFAAGAVADFHSGLPFSVLPFADLLAMSPWAMEETTEVDGIRLGLDF